MHLTRTPLVLAVIACCLGNAYAQTSRITQVTVYPGSATVERTLTLAAGAKQAVFACLPAGLDPQTLQVHTADKVEVGELAVRLQPRELIADCAHPQQARIRTLEDQIAALQAEAQGLEHAGGWLARYEQSTGSAQIATTADALRRTGQTVAERQHAIQRQQQALQEQLRPLQADQQRTGADNSQAHSVQITLSAPQGGTLALSYQVRGPGWQPGYRASLDVERQRVVLERTAQVAQSSGEDWNNVPLTLSTGQPNASANGPLPRPWRITEVEPQPAPELRIPAPAAAVARASARPSSMRAEAADAGAPTPFDASVFEGSHATTFTLPQRITIPSRGERLSVSLGQHPLDARLLVRTTPAQDTAAYLTASFTLPEGIWPSGPVRLYRDGAYVGAAHLDAQTIAQTGLGFGRDERVQVRALPVEQMRGQTGLIGSRKQREVRNAWEVHNRHSAPIALQVLDAAPVAEQQDIRVASSYSPQPTQVSWNEQPGAVLWELTLPPAGNERITSTHTISWPEAMRVREQRY